jgi:hypothetical protein
LRDQLNGYAGIALGHCSSPLLGALSGAPNAAREETVDSGNWFGLLRVAGYLNQPTLALSDLYEPTGGRNGDKV